MITKDFAESLWEKDKSKFSLYHEEGEKCKELFIDFVIRAAEYFGKTGSDFLKERSNETQVMVKNF